MRKDREENKPHHREVIAGRSQEAAGEPCDEARCRLGLRIGTANAA